MSAPRARRLRAGFTLIELVVSLLVSTLVIGAAVSLLVGQQRLFQTSSADRSLQDTARVALGELTDTIRGAGFGVDPGFTIDFGLLPSVVMMQAPLVAGVTPRAGGFACATPVTCRDKVDGPDELVVYARDASFGRPVASVTGTSAIAIVGPRTPALDKGPILQLMCTSGAMPWAYVTVSAYVAPANTATVAVPLAAATGQPQDFPAQNATLADGCFGDGTALVTKVNRFRYYVRSFSTAGAVVAAQSVGSRPFLMLDQGLFDQNGAAVTTAVAADVEDIQFSYVYPAGAVTLVGETAGAQITADAAGVDTGALGPGFGTSPADAARATQHPANIRAVRVFVTVRPPTADIKVPDAAVPAAANRPALPGLAGYRRLQVSTTVALPNMDSRAPYFPMYTTNAGADNLNFGGG